MSCGAQFWATARRNYLGMSSAARSSSRRSALAIGPEAVPSFLKARLAVSGGSRARALFSLIWSAAAPANCAVMRAARQRFNIQEFKKNQHKMLINLLDRGIIIFNVGFISCPESEKLASKRLEETALKFDARLYKSNEPSYQGHNHFASVFPSGKCIKS